MLIKEKLVWVLYIMRRTINLERDHSVSSAPEQGPYQLQLIYSSSLLGHYTMIISNDELACRIHMVDQDALMMHKKRMGSIAGKLAYLSYKFTQLCGCSNFKIIRESSTPDIDPVHFFQWRDYANQDVGRQCVLDVTISQMQFDGLMKYCDRLNRDSSVGYGYIMYSSSVVNCGRFVMNALDHIGVDRPDLPWLVTWTYAPSLTCSYFSELTTQAVTPYAVMPRANSCKFRRIGLQSPSPNIFRFFKSHPSGDDQNVLGQSSRPEHSKPRELEAVPSDAMQARVF